MISAAVYLRVSKKDGSQDEANQWPDCLKLCEARGWTPTVFEDRESGAKERPGWRALIEAARKGTVRAVVFWALDRTGRNAVQVAHDLGELFRWNVHVASVKDSWLDIGAGMGPLRDLLVQVMAWVAEGERRRIRERSIVGQARARAEGRLPGRPRVDVPGKAVIRAYVLRLQGLGWRLVAAQLSREGLGTYDHATLMRACKKGRPEGPAKAA